MKLTQLPNNKSSYSINYADIGKRLPAITPANLIDMSVTEVNACGRP